MSYDELNHSLTALPFQITMMSHCYDGVSQTLFYLIDKHVTLCMSVINKHVTLYVYHQQTCDTVCLSSTDMSKNISKIKTHVSTIQKILILLNIYKNYSTNISHCMHVMNKHINKSTNTIKTHACIKYIIILVDKYIYLQLKQNHTTILTLELSRGSMARVTYSWRKYINNN